MSAARARRRTLIRFLTVVMVGAGLLAAAGCCGESSVSSDQIQRDAKVVFRADLKPGSNGAAAARISQRLIRVGGVWGTNGDSGRHVWIYSTRAVTPAQVRGIRRVLSRDSWVASIKRTR